VDLAEVAAERFHQASRTAPDFKRSPSPPIGLCWQPLELRFDRAENVGGGGVKLGFVLISSPERNVVVRVFARALVPIGTHALADGIFRIAHLL
jgi:hypothetical protein